MEKEGILNWFSLFSFKAGGGGIGTLLTPDTDQAIFKRLSDLTTGSVLSLEEFNQLLLLANEANLTRDFFEYYWLQTPEHPYDVTTIDGYDSHWGKQAPGRIVSLDHLRWGLYRLYVDGLLYFGNVRTAFRHLRKMNKHDLRAFFRARRFDTDGLRQRGPALQPQEIDKHDRYLIAESASKCFAGCPATHSELNRTLSAAWQTHCNSGRGPAKIRDLTKALPEGSYERILLGAAHILDKNVRSVADVETIYLELAANYFDVRSRALKNTDLYLSMVNEMDVYVATSMRTQRDFIEMADFSESVFQDGSLTEFHIRYFDPTLSAAACHEDKGLTECLMVKCAKALVYCAGDKESYGKDAEAAMALSLGKPVIFYCRDKERKDLYRDVHPLSRLIEFETGVAVGAMVTDSQDEVRKLLARLLGNRMEYRLEQRQDASGYLKLIECLTGSVVRVQTNNNLLTETFWNHYHDR